MNRSKDAFEIYPSLKKEMSHYDVLNAILANECRRDIDPKTGVLTFEFSLHCASVRIKAELISTVDTIQYKILDFEIGNFEID